MKIAMFKTSQHENEHRLPLHPQHLPLIPEALRKKLVFEQGYGNDFGFDDEYFRQHGVEMSDYASLFGKCEIIAMPKPRVADLERMKEGQTLFGWVHAVQQRPIAQKAIDKKLTLIAWEAMHHWSSVDEKQLHVFYTNNEIAGYCAVLHSLQLLGIDGFYGPRRRVLIFGYGSVSRGAIHALHGRGFNNIHVLTQRPSHLVAHKNPDVYFGQYYTGEDGKLMVRDSEGRVRPLIEEIAEADIICNGILQDPLNPVMFVEPETAGRLKQRALIIDISCDEGMGFPFARPTTFDEPTFTVDRGVTYYSVDHTPTYLWNATTREISNSVLQYLDVLSQGPDVWETNKTLSRAIEIKDGVVRNPAILKFQNRHEQYPHPYRTELQLQG